MRIAIERERQEGGRWMAVAPALPGVPVYGQDEAHALQRVQALALHYIADRLENGELVSGLACRTFSTSSAYASGAVC